MDKEKDLEYKMDEVREKLMEHHDGAYGNEIELHSMRRKMLKLEQKSKHEQYMRRRYPSVNEAYKQYQMLLKLTKNHKQKINKLEEQTIVYKGKTMNDNETNFIKKLIDKNAQVTIFLINGVKLSGEITSVDDNTLNLKRDKHTQLVYKNAISTIMPIEPLDI